MEACEQTEGAVTVFADGYLEEVKTIAGRLDGAAIDRMAAMLAEVRDGGGRVFFLGVGGGAANASHAVNDFRKIAGMECYAPSDHMSELTARINDQGWDGCYAEWLRGSRLGERDAVFVFSVGGGNLEKRVSVNLMESLKLALWPLSVLVIVGLYGLDENTVLVPNGIFWMMLVMAAVWLEGAWVRERAAVPSEQEWAPGEAALAYAESAAAAG